MLNEHEMRAYLDARLQREDLGDTSKPTCVVLFRPEFVEITGSLNAALMLSQCVCWHYVAMRSGKQSFYKSIQDWEYETGLSEERQISARRTLIVLGMIRVKTIGRPKQMYYFVNIDRILKRLDEHRAEVKQLRSEHISGKSGIAQIREIRKS